MKRAKRTVKQVERVDLRAELMERLRNPETRAEITDALLREARGGEKGGATVLRAYELIRELAESDPEPDVSEIEPDLRGMTDAELRALLAQVSGP